MDFSNIAEMLNEFIEKFMEILVKLQEWLAGLIGGGDDNGDDEIE